ncbi:ScbR family autoregulator-binding transcription factor [Streptomyces sp. NPDC046805]|uniref:ScbR family autoregulator-binding transcription factor n=1 Tax=Streptomyces sp. NPDC046805 TaxID=3155134 RepID=UPI0033C70F88
MALQERAIRTRQSILAAAAAVFAEVGYEAATIAEILRRARVTKGALYFHFPSKEELARAVLAEHLSAVPQPPPRELILQESLDGTFLLAHLLSRGEPLVQGGVRLAMDQGRPNDRLERRLPIAGWIERNVALLSRAKEKGELLPQVDVAAAARNRVAVFAGAQVLSKVMTGHADLEERVADIERHVMASIAVPAVLVRLDMAPDRGARVYEEAMRLRRRTEAATAG